MIKNYVLDTNVLLNSPNAVYGFEDNNVIITGTTLQELDKFKSAQGEIGYSARECCRILDSLREQGDLTKGIHLPNGGNLIVRTEIAKEENLPFDFSLDSPDNKIISTGISLKEENYDIPVILVSNDISMRVNASACGLAVESYKNDQSSEDIYYGYRTIETESEVINSFYKDDKLVIKEVRDKLEGVGRKNPLLENEYLILKCGNQSALGRVSKGNIVKLREHTLFGSIQARNVVQKFAIDALLAPPSEIPLVILIGPAGTAKTFLSLAAGLTETKLGYGDDGLYNRILISRPNVMTTEQGYGFLPGSLEEKMSPLLACYYDNLDTILRNKEKKEDSTQIQIQVDDYIDTGVIQLCPLNFIRGRSLVNSFFICDEAQNAPKSLIRDVVTRAGIGTKVVVCGDVNQVDAIQLDSRNNGLSFVADRMKGDKLVAVVRFTEEHCVRSALAESAIKKMN